MSRLFIELYLDEDVHVLVADLGMVQQIWPWLYKKGQQRMGKRADFFDLYNPFLS